MTYLQDERILYLLLALVVGAILGWLFRSFFIGKKWETRYLSLKDTNKQVQLLLDDSEAKSSRLNEQAKKLASKLALKSSDNTTLVKAFSNLQVDRNQLKTKIESLHLKFKETSEDTKTLEALSGELEDKNIQLGNHIDQVVEDRRKIEKLKTFVTTLNEKNSNLHRELTLSESTSKKTTTQIDNLKSNHKDLLSKYAKLKSNFSNLQSQIDSTNQNGNQAKQQVKKLVAENETLQSSLAQAQEEAKKETSKLKETRDQAQKKYTVSFDEIQQLKAELKKSKDSDRESAIELQQFRNAKNENKSLNAKIITLSSARDQLIKDLDKSTRVNESDTSQIHALKNQIETLESAAKKLNNVVKQGKQATLDISNLKSKLSTLETDKKKLSVELRTAQKKGAAINKLEKQLSDQHAKINTNKSSWESEIKRHEEYLMKSETRWASETKNLQDLLDSTKIAHEAAIEKATEKTKAFKVKLLTLTSERDKLTETTSNEVQAVKDKLVSLSSERDSLIRASNKISSDSKSKLVKSSSQISKLKTKIKTLEQKLQQRETIDNRAPQKIPTKLDKRKDTKPQAKNENLEKDWKEAHNISSVPSNKSTAKPVAQLNKELDKQSANKQAKTQSTQSTLSTLSALTAHTKPYPAQKATKQTNGDKIRYPIEAIEGIGVVYGKRFRNININFVDTLLNKGKNPAGRKSLAERTDINKSLILTWVNHADLFRIHGVEGDYAELLEASGVDTVKALRNRNAANLTLRMESTNEEKRLAPQAPKESDVIDWIAQAGRLDPMLSYSNSSSSVISKATKKSTHAPSPTADDLTKIKGVGKVNEKRLHSLGIQTFEQIAKFTKQDEKSYGAKLSSFHERITKERWVKQAKELHKIKYGKSI